jgi:hypothetical protein
LTCDSKAEWLAQEIPTSDEIRSLTNAIREEQTKLWGLSRISQESRMLSHRPFFWTGLKPHHDREISAPKEVRETLNSFILLKFEDAVSALLKHNPNLAGVVSEIKLRQIALKVLAPEPLNMVDPFPPPSACSPRTRILHPTTTFSPHFDHVFAAKNPPVRLPISRGNRQTNRNEPHNHQKSTTTHHKSPRLVLSTTKWSGLCYWLWPLSEPAEKDSQARDCEQT